MNKQGYVCLGSCQAVVSEEQHRKGLTACGNDICELKGKPFVLGSKCEKCGLNYSQQESHQH